MFFYIYDILLIGRNPKWVAKHQEKQLVWWWLFDADAPDDADPGPQDLLLWPQYTHTHRLQKSCGGKGTAWPLSQEESAPTLALTGFHCFSRPFTSKMVLLYYAKLCFGWLSFADKGEGVAEYITGGYLQCKRRNGPNGYVPYLEGLAQILGR